LQNIQNETKLYYNKQHADLMTSTTGLRVEI
jgi:hypothetical protein